MYGTDRNRQSGFRAGGGFAPVKEGEEINVTIEAVGEKGDGIAKVKGFVIFVPNTTQGAAVKIRITKVLRKVGFGEVIGAGTAQKTEEYSDYESTEETAGEESTEEQQDEDSEDFGEDGEENKEN